MEYYYIVDQDLIQHLRITGTFFSPWEAGLLITELQLQELCSAMGLTLVEKNPTRQPGIFHPHFERAGEAGAGAPQSKRRKRKTSAVAGLGTNARDAYMAICTARLGTEVQELEAQVRRGREQVEAIRQQLANTSATVKAAAERLDGIHGKLGVDAERFGREFDALMANPMILDIQIDGDRLKAFTRALYCQDPRDGRWHEIGKFRIEIPTNGSGGPRWANLSRKVNAAHERMNAPHVSSEGAACLGNTAETFARMIGDYEYEAAVLYAIQFVQSVNTNDAWGRYIDRWPVVSEETATGKKEV